MYPCLEMFSLQSNAGRYRCQRRQSPSARDVDGLASTYVSTHTTASPHRLASIGSRRASLSDMPAAPFDVKVEIG